jgi:putative flippase GtrA
MKQSKKELILEMIRFLIVGGIATLVDYAVFYFCNLIVFKALDTNLNLILSTALGFTVGLLTNWFLQKFVYRYITKRQTRSKAVFIKFVVISLIGLLITELGINIAAPIYPTLELTIFNITFQFWKLFMKVLMTCVVLVFNYIGRKYFVFKFENPEENLDKEPVDEKNTSE